MGVPEKSWRAHACLEVAASFLVQQIFDQNWQIFFFSREKKKSAPGCERSCSGFCFVFYLIGYLCGFKNKYTNTIISPTLCKRNKSPPQDER